MEKLNERTSYPRRRISPREHGDRVVEFCKDLPWKCGACDALLAFVDAETRTTVRIKRSDLYVEHFVGKGGHVKIMCRTCGVQNKISDDELADHSPEEVGA